jgi:hypothetical protein
MIASISFFQTACLLSVAALLYGQSSTVGWVPKDDSFVLVIHGASDTTVPLEQSVGLNPAVEQPAPL